MKNPDAEKNNPCLKEQNISYKCLSDKNFDKEKCSVQFQNYKNCKNFWGAVYSMRRAKRIAPYLPPVEERERIKTEYLQTGKINV